MPSASHAAALRQPRVARNTEGRSKVLDQYTDAESVALAEIGRQGVDPELRLLLLVLVDPFRQADDLADQGLPDRFRAGS